MTIQTDEPGVGSTRPVRYYFAWNTSDRVMNGRIDVVLEDADGADHAWAEAKRAAADAADPLENWYGMLTVYDDYTVGISDFSISELTEEE